MLVENDQERKPMEKMTYIREQYIKRNRHTNHKNHGPKGKGRRNEKREESDSEGYQIKDRELISKTLVRIQEQWNRVFQHDSKSARQRARRKDSNISAAKRPKQTLCNGTHTNQNRKSGKNTQRKKSIGP